MLPGEGGASQHILPLAPEGAAVLDLQKRKLKQAALRPGRQIQSSGVRPRASPRSGQPCPAAHDTPAPSPHASGAGLPSAQAWAVPSTAMSAPRLLRPLRACLGNP